MAEERSCVQLIDEKGIFHATGFKHFGKDVKMDNWGDSYNVVSIMDPHSGGESTLLNRLFDTKCAVMDASTGRKKATRGIWVAKSGNKPRTLAMDMGGSDSRNRGENGTKFENWSALFALAISDVVLINMSGPDIGRKDGASKPLLKTVLKFMRCTPRKVTLMFVLRDQTTAPANKLKKNIWEYMKKIWDSAGSRRKLEEFFDFNGQLEVAALCSYEEKKKKEYNKQVAKLKEKICGIVREKRKVVPASSFSKNAQQIWKEIKDIKDPSIPSIKVLVDKFQCDRIAIVKFQRFKRDYKAKMGSVELLSSHLDSCLSEYDEETQHYDEDVRSEKRKGLKAKLQRRLLKETQSNRNKGKMDIVAQVVATALNAAGIAFGLPIPIAGIAGAAGAAVKIAGAAGAAAGKYLLN